MIWVILAVLGVPLWLCAAGLWVLVMRNRAIRHRPGNVKVRRRRSGKSRWTRGHGVWVHDVFAFRGSPAAWAESLIPVRDVVTTPWLVLGLVRMPTGRFTLSETSSNRVGVTVWGHSTLL